MAAFDAHYIGIEEPKAFRVGFDDSSLEGYKFVRVGSFDILNFNGGETGLKASDDENGFWWKYRSIECAINTTVSGVNMQMMLHEIIAVIIESCSSM